MALLKAFVCQVILLGLYKLFLEQVVEDHLVPDELTRNCLVGFVCLLCFGIQLYTDKTEDEDSVEADENPEEKSKTRRSKSEKKFEPPEISGIHESVGSNASSRVTATKLQTAREEIATEKKMSPNDKAEDLRERSNAVPSAEPGKVTEACHWDIFDKFSPNMPDTIPNVMKVDGMREPEMSASTTQTSYAQKSIYPVLNEFSESNVCEESDEDCIEIDQFVAKESAKETEQFRTVKTDEIEPIKVKVVTEETNQLRSVEDKEFEVIKPEDVTEEARQLRTVEYEIETIKPDVESECLTVNDNISSTQDSNKTTTLEIGESSEARITNCLVEESLHNRDNIPEPGDVESECLTVNEDNISSTQDLNKTTTLETGESSEAEINGKVEESLNNIDSISSNIIEETDRKKLIKDGCEIIQELSSKPGEYTEDIIEKLPSAQEMRSNTSSTSTKVLNDVDTMNENNVETSTVVKTPVSSPSEKLMVSTTRQNTIAAENVCVAPVTIDISFIYACH